MDELITIRKEQAVTSSLQVAEMFHKRHDNVLRDIQNLDCSKEFRLLNFEESSYTNEQNKKQPIFYITKDGFTFLVMGYRGKKAAEFKEAYIKQFNAMEQILAEKHTSAWIESRKQGKITRKNETDVIKELVEYAKAQGSTHSDMLYMTYTRLVNRTIGVKNRDNASILQINNLTLAEHIVLNTIRNGMAAGKTYKEIYQDSKTQLEAFSEIAFLPTLIKTEGA